MKDCNTPYFLSCNLKFGDLKSELQSEKKKIQHQDQRISVLERKNIDLETYMRRHDIIVEGKHERENENCTNVVLSCLREEYGIPVTEDGIDKCHRFGRSTGGRPRPIIVRFLRHATRDQVLFAARSHENKPRGVYINEDVSPYLTFTNLNTIEHDLTFFLKSC